MEVLALFGSTVKVVRAIALSSLTALWWSVVIRGMTGEALS